MQRFITYTGIIGFALGVALSSLYPSVNFDTHLLLLLAFALGAIALRQSFEVERWHYVLAPIFLVAVACGLWRTSLFEANLAAGTLPPTGEFVFEGLVTKEPDKRTQSTQLHVFDGTRTLLVVTDRYTAVAYGDRVTVTGALTSPERFMTDLGRTFDYPGYLKASGVTQVVRYAEVAVVESGQGNWFIARLLELKGAFIAQIEQYLPEPHAGLAEGLLLGVKRALGDELEQIFRRTGIIHIVVLSGYNIMLIVAFVLYVLSFVMPWRGRLLVGIAAIASFALMVGLSATVLRASLMAALALVARTLGRTHDIVHALCVAGFVMLCINPYLLVFDVGFQLSFLATLGLIIVAPLLESPLERVPATIGIREFLIATLATQLFVLPILLYQIGELSVVSVAVNVLVLPVVPVAMLATFLMVILSMAAPPLALPFSWLAYLTLTYMLAVPAFFAELPFASFTVPAFPFFVVVAAYATIGYLVYRWQQLANPLANWTIEEESILDVHTLPPTETPVFFR